jgi:hypothetical protein
MGRISLIERPGPELTRPVHLLSGNRNRNGLSAGPFAIFKHEKPGAVSGTGQGVLFILSSV